MSNRKLDTRTHTCTHSREEGPPLLLEEIGRQQSSGVEGGAAGHGSVELAGGGGQV